MGMRVPVAAAVAFVIELFTLAVGPHTAEPSPTVPLTGRVDSASVTTKDVLVLCKHLYFSNSTIRLRQWGIFTSRLVALLRQPDAGQDECE